MSEFMHLSHLSKQALKRVKDEAKAERYDAIFAKDLDKAETLAALIRHIEYDLLPHAEDRPEDDGGQGAMF